MIRKILKKILGKLVPELNPILNGDVRLTIIKNELCNVKIGELTHIEPPYRLNNITLGKGTYISVNSRVSETRVGKFCSIGPNFLCGWGIHPTNGLSTSPYFYSTRNQNGSTIADKDLLIERKPINIGNDVFIGANVTVLDGVSIGDGAVIGAGSIVTKDIPAYAIAYGNPIKIKRMRFNKAKQEMIKKIAWWNFDDEKLKEVHQYFYNIDVFIEKHIN